MALSLKCLSHVGSATGVQTMLPLVASPKILSAFTPKVFGMLSPKAPASPSGARSPSFFVDRPEPRAPLASPFGLLGRAELIGAPRPRFAAAAASPPSPAFPVMLGRFAASCAGSAPAPLGGAAEPAPSSADLARAAFLERRGRLEARSEARVAFAAAVGNTAGSIPRPSVPVLLGRTRTTSTLSTRVPEDYERSDEGEDAGKERSLAARTREAVLARRRAFASRFAQSSA